MQRNIHSKLNADDNKNGISVRTAGVSVLTLRTSVFLAYLSCNRRNSIHNRLFYEQTFFQESVSKGLNQPSDNTLCKVDIGIIFYKIAERNINTIQIPKSNTIKQNRYLNKNQNSIPKQMQNTKKLPVI